MTSPRLPGGDGSTGPRSPRLSPVLWAARQASGVSQTSAAVPLPGQPRRSRHTYPTWRLITRRLKAIADVFSTATWRPRKSSCDGQNSRGREPALPRQASRLRQGLRQKSPSHEWRSAHPPGLFFTLDARAVRPLADLLARRDERRAVWAPTAQTFTSLIRLPRPDPH